MNSQQPHIEETIEKLTELAHSYERALECSNQIISMKNRYIELCEMETALHRKENLRLQRMVFWLSIMVLISSVIHIIKAFI